jgi:hypothetical protein
MTNNCPCSVTIYFTKANANASLVDTNLAMKTVTRVYFPLVRTIKALFIDNIYVF